MQQTSFNAITTQPGFVPGQPQPAQWMQPPIAPADCPPGLEYLTMIDQILCRQVVELLEAFTGWETNNKYSLMNSMGQQIYYAFEDASFIQRMMCGPRREFTMHVVNYANQEVLRVHRPFKCCAGCCWCAGCCTCCSMELQVEAPPGNIIGHVRQKGTGCGLDYSICDATGDEQVVIVGPRCVCACCSDIEFPVFTKDKTQRIGCVTKQWTGVVREMYTNADNFGVTFPMDLDVKTKATLIGATFLIDFMAFEQTKNNSSIGDLIG